MQCANPRCHNDALEVPGGTVYFLELEVPPEDRVQFGDTGFPVCLAPSRFFWLCPRCSRLHAVRRWTPEGIVLEPVLDAPPAPAEAPMPAMLPARATPSRTDFTGILQKSA